MLPLRHVKQAICIFSNRCWCCVTWHLDTLEGKSAPFYIQYVCHHSQAENIDPLTLLYLVFLFQHQTEIWLFSSVLATPCVTTVVNHMVSSNFHLNSSKALDWLIYYTATTCCTLFRTLHSYENETPPAFTSAFRINLWFFHCFFKNIHGRFNRLCVK